MMTKLTTATPTSPSITDQFKSIFPLLLKVYVPTALSLLVLVYVNFATEIKVSYFTRDPIQIVEAPIYYGIYSNLGVLLWAATAAICLFSAAILKRLQGQKRIASFLLYAGYLTTFLLFDDLFLFHEEVFPNYLYIPDVLVYAGYALSIVFFLIAFHALIKETPFLLLVFAFIFFAISILIDIPDIPFYGQHFIEDGCKLFGIVSWATYFIYFCQQQVLRHK